jgi:hypothetical protein
MGPTDPRGGHPDRITPLAAATAVAIGAVLNGVWRGRDWWLLVVSTLAAFLITFAIAAYLRRPRDP